MPCPYWICGLESPAIVVGHVRKRSSGKVFLTTGEPHASKGIVLKIASTIKIAKDEYGLVVVSCSNTVKEEQKKELMKLEKSINQQSEKILDSKLEKIIDLSKLEVIAFFSFLDPSDSNVRMSSEIGLWHYKNLFKQFINKDEHAQRRELWSEYSRHQQPQGSSKSSKMSKGDRGSSVYDAPTAGPN